MEKLPDENDYLDEHLNYQLKDNNQGQQVNQEFFTVPIKSQLNNISNFVKSKAYPVHNKSAVSLGMRKSLKNNNLMGA